eukprot:2320638-Rhodomonas_salina.3
MCFQDPDHFKRAVRFPMSHTNRGACAGHVLCCEEIVLKQSQIRLHRFVGCGLIFGASRRFADLRLSHALSRQAEGEHTHEDDALCLDVTVAVVADSQRRPTLASSLRGSAST